MGRPKLSNVERAMNAVLDLTTEERNSFDVNLRIVEEKLHGARPAKAAPRRKPAPKPAPGDSNG